MRKFRLIILCFAMLLCCAFVGGFGGKNDENRHKTAQNGVYECALNVEISPALATLGTLSAPQNLAFSTSGIASFDAVENAESYNVRLYDQGGNKVCDVSTSSNSVDLSENMLSSAGAYYFSVMAMDVDSEYDNSEYSAVSNTVSTVSLTISYSLSVGASFPTSAVALVGKKYADCLSKINVDVDKYDYVWCFEDGGNAGDEIGDAVVENGRLSVVAKYIGKPYTVQFVTNGGLPVANKTCYYDAYNTTPIGTCGTEKQGYTFVGWCFNQDLSDEPFWSIPKETFGEIKLYAKWKIKAFNIVVDIFSNCDKEYDGLGVSFGVSMDSPASPYINYTYNWYKGAVKDENIVSTSAVSTTYTTGAGIDCSGNYFVKVIAQNPYDIEDYYFEQSSPITVTIRKCTPIVTSFGTPVADGTFGNNLSSISLQGVTANTSGNVTFDSPDTALEVGKHNYAVTFVPDDADNYNEVKGAVEINTIIPKDKRTLEIEFSVPDKMVENGEEYTVLAVATNLEGDDDVKLLLSNNIQSRAGKYTATVVGMEIIKAEYFDYQLPNGGLTCEFEILSAQIRTSDELSSDFEGTFVDDEGVPYGATIKILSADFDVSGLNISDNQKVVGKYTVDLLSGDESILRTGKISLKTGEKDIDFENAELYKKTDGGFEKIDFVATNGTITFDAETPASVVLVCKVAPVESPQKSYTWLIILLTCIVLVMAFVIIFLALRVSKSLRKEGKNKNEKLAEKADEISTEQKDDFVQVDDAKIEQITDEKIEVKDGENKDANLRENDTETSIEYDAKISKENVVESVTETVVDKSIIVEEESASGDEVSAKEEVERVSTADVECVCSVSKCVEVQTEESVDGKKRKTFEDKLKEQNEEFIGYYNALKDCIMRYEGIKVRTSSGGETFRYKRAVAKLTIDGKTLRLHLALDPNDEKYNDGTCPHKDMSAYESYRDLPFMFKVKSGLALRRAIRLIEDAMEIAGTKKPQ